MSAVVLFFFFFKSSPFHLQNDRFFNSKLGCVADANQTIDFSLYLLFTVMWHIALYKRRVYCSLCGRYFLFLLFIWKHDQCSIQTFFWHTVFLKSVHKCFSDTWSHPMVEAEDLKIFSIWCYWGRIFVFLKKKKMFLKYFLTVSFSFNIKDSQKK